MATCGNPIRLDAEDPKIVLCDRELSHGGRHASYEHGCKAILFGNQCQLPPGHRGPHRADGEYGDLNQPWSTVWLDRHDCGSFLPHEEDHRLCKNCGLLHPSRSPEDWKR